MDGFEKGILRRVARQMKGAMLYVNAGKGHYIPAKALQDSFIEAGYECVLEDLFVVFDTPFWEFFCKYDWRFLLHHPNFEPLLHKTTDTRFNFKLIKAQGIAKHKLRSFEKWYNENKPDFIVSTNFLGGIFLPEACRLLGIDIPIYQYAADVFDSPISGINPDLTRMYVPSVLGKENVIKRGQPEETVATCPFPLQTHFEKYVKLTKHEARDKLGLENKFTVLVNLGGEGIWNTALLRELVERNYDIQVVAIGGLSVTTQNAFKRFRQDNPHFTFLYRGFVSNVQEYISACDVQIGKAGANAVMESMYIGRPFIVTQILYAFRASKDFFENRKVGWCENNVIKQADIIGSLYLNPDCLDRIDDRFATLPMNFGAAKFRDQIICDTQEYYRTRLK